MPICRYGGWGLCATNALILVHDDVISMRTILEAENLSATCHRRSGRSCGTNSVLVRQTHVKMVKYCENAITTLKILSRTIRQPFVLQPSLQARSAARSDRPSRWTLATCTRSLAHSSLRNPNFGHNVVIPAATVTASSAMHRAAGWIIC